LGNNEKESKEGLKLLKIKYTPLYEELIKPKGSVSK